MLLVACEAACTLLPGCKLLQLPLVASCCRACEAIELLSSTPARMPRRRAACSMLLASKVKGGACLRRRDNGAVEVPSLSNDCPSSRQQPEVQILYEAYLTFYIGHCLYTSALLSPRSCDAPVIQAHC
jgi:hypothetical protein